MIFKRMKYISVFNSIDFTLLKKTFLRNGHKIYCRLKPKFPIFIKFKFLRFRLRSKAGRSTSGRVILWTRKALSYRRIRYLVNYSFRYSFINFVASIFLERKTLKAVSIVFFASGSMCYLPSTHDHSLFNITKMYKPQTKVKDIYYRLKKINYSLVDFLFIRQSFFFINHLPRHQPVSLLELIAGKGIQYVRSSGVFAIMIKLDVKTSIAVVKLPSGVKKIFSALSLGSVGVNPHKLTKYWKSNKAGYYNNLGEKSRVRGVARNPVDHLHGGRTKTLKYPRTPWGLTTKYK